MYTDEEEDDHEKAAEAEQGMEPEGGEEADLGRGGVPEPEVGAHRDTEAHLKPERVLLRPEIVLLRPDIVLLTPARMRLHRLAAGLLCKITSVNLLSNALRSSHAT